MEMLLRESKGNYYDTAGASLTLAAGATTIEVLQFVRP
jgi:hypothetical protein